jgi:hypothetical protein
MGAFNITKLVDPIQFTTIAGGLTPRGAYNAGTDYAVGDSVDYNGSSYVMFNDAGAGTLPTNTTYWQVLANKGATGSTGATGATGSAGSNGTNGTNGQGVPTGGTTNQALVKNSNTDYDTKWVTPAGGGDMLAATYDPNSVASDAFNMDNMEQGSTKKYVSATDVTHLGNLSGTNTGDQTLPVKASGAELDTGTDDAKFATAKALVDSHNVPSVAPSTAGKLMRSNGTDWTSASVTTADIAASIDKNYVTDAQQTVIGNTIGTNTGDQTLPTDATIATTDITTNNASTTKHGFLLKATAPSSGNLNVVGIANGETVYADKGLLDTTAPSTQAYGDSASAGTSLVAARVDHKHAMPATTKDTTAQTGILKGNGSTVSAVTAPSGTIVGTSDSQALTNKDLTGAGNTFPTFNQNTSGSAATLTTSRNINGVAFNGSANITVPTLPIAAAPGTQTAQGVIVAMTYGESITLGDVLYVKASDGKVYKADATSIATAKYPGLFLALATASSASNNVLVVGIYQDTTKWTGGSALTVGGICYLSTTAGGTTQTQPSSTDNIIQVTGVAIAADTIYFNPTLTFITHT